MTAVDIHRPEGAHALKRGTLIAVPSDDHVTIATHFGRARGFIVYRIDGDIEEVGYRTVIHEEKQHCGCAEGERPSRHEAVLEALDGCKTVIARGMGAHMYDDLQACGLTVVLTDASLADQAVEQFAEGSLPAREGLGCEHIHGHEDLR